MDSDAPIQSDSPLNIRILGSGTSTGVPVIGCRCAVCSSKDPRDNRTRSSALISYQGKNILIDAATDLRQQALRHQLRQIDAVLFTHTHADHVNGIDDLRVFNMLSGSSIPIFATEEDLHALRRSFSYVFNQDQEEGYRPQLIPRLIEGPFRLFGLDIIPIPLTHGQGRATGYRIGPFAYLTDCNEIPDSSLALLQGVETLVIDGLRHRPHSSHFSIAQALASTDLLNAQKRWLTHLSHDVFHARDESLLPPGCALAYDGLNLSFNIPTPSKAQKHTLIHISEFLQ